MQRHTCPQDSDLDLPTHGVIFVHGSVLQDYVKFYIKKGYGIRIESNGNAYKIIYSKKMQGIKYAKSALNKLKGNWIYPYSYRQMSKAILTHEYLNDIGKFFEYKGKYWKEYNMPYRMEEFYEQG